LPPYILIVDALLSVKNVLIERFTLENTLKWAYIEPMTENERVLELVKLWVEKVGRKEALRRLVIQEVPPVTADKIIAGRYSSTPRALLAKVLLEEMAADGLSLDDVAS
jgi:hypothetical protein